jgi:hypothetical protein
LIHYPLRKHPIYNIVYVFWSHLILFELLPYVVIMVCNGFIIAKIYKASKFRQTFCGSSTNVKRRYMCRDEFGICRILHLGFEKSSFIVFTIVICSRRKNVTEEGSVFLSVCCKRGLFFARVSVKYLPVFERLLI